MKYRANRNTAIFPFGLIAKGEALRPEQIEALGGEALMALVARGVLVKIGGPAPVDGNMGAAATEEDEADQADAEIDDAEDEADQADAEIDDAEDETERADADIDEDAEDETERADAPEDELAGLDDLMGEAENETEVKPEAKKATRGRKAR